MKINNVSIKNFRNIKEVNYELSNMNIFAGANQQGKTNTIEAINWCLTGRLFGEKADITSIKPDHDTSLKVEVEIEFDNNFKIKREYLEKWTKTRGSDVVTMTGHDTNLYINDTKEKNITEATSKIREFLGGEFESKFTKKEFDYIRAITDPYYIGLIASWKPVREFIFALVGEVDDLEILKDEKFKMIEERLKLDSFDTSITSKYFKQMISENKKQIVDLETQNKGLETILDVTDEAHQSAIKEIENIDNIIKTLREPIVDENRQKIINEMQSQLNDLHSKINESIANDRKVIEFENNQINDEVNQKQKVVSDLMNDINQMNSKMNDIRQKSYEFEQSMNFKNTKINAHNERVNELRNQYKIEKEKEFTSFVSLPETSTCSNCGHVLNQEIIENVNQLNENNLNEFNQAKMQTLQKIINNKNQLDAEVEEAKQEAKEIQVGLDSTKRQLQRENELISEKQNQLRLLNDELQLIKNKLKPFVDSDNTSNLKQKLELDTKSFNEVKNAKNSVEIDYTRISELESSKNELNQVLEKRIAFTQNQKAIQFNLDKIETVTKELIKYEQRDILLQEFIETKLNMMDAKVSNLFDNRVKFVLVESNIKEGSWNPVCYPLIIDSNTKFEKGSGSEKILTGIYIIECIRKFLGAEELPIIFDESEKIDTSNMKKLNTNAQIITSKVDDVNYQNLTLVKQ